MPKQEKVHEDQSPADRRAKAISQDALEKEHAQQEGQARVLEILSEREVGLVVNG